MLVMAFSWHFLAKHQGAASPKSPFSDAPWLSPMGAARRVGEYDAQQKSL